MRIHALLAFLLLAVPAMARQPLDTLSPAQAIARAASASPKPVRAIFQFRVASAAKTRDGYYLNSEQDFRAATNLAVVIKPSAMAGLTKKYGANLKAALVGKTIKVIGQARRVPVGGQAGKPAATATRIDLTHAGQILSVS